MWPVSRMRLNSSFRGCSTLGSCWYTSAGKPSGPAAFFLARLCIARYTSISLKGRKSDSSFILYLLAVHGIFFGGRSADARFLRLPGVGGVVVTTPGRCGGANLDSTKFANRAHFFFVPKCLVPLGSFKGALQEGRHCLGFRPSSFARYLKKALMSDGWVLERWSRHPSLDMPVMILLACCVSICCTALISIG